MMLAPTTTLGSEMPQANLDDEARQMIEDAGYNADYVAERDSEVDLSNAEPIIDGLPGFNENETQMWIDSARELYATFGPRRAPTRSRQGGKMVFTPAAEPDESAMSDDEVAQWGVELMGSYNYRPEEWLNYFTNADSMTERQKVAFYNLLSGYDKLPDGTWSGTMRMLKGTATSPSTYVGIGTLGTGFAARKVFKDLGKTGVMNYMKSLMPTTIAAGVEGGLYTGLDDAMRQISAIDAGAQDEFSVGQTAVATGVGVVTGGTLGLGLPAAGKGAVEGAKLLNRGLDAGVEMMGGGRTLGMGAGPVPPDPMDLRNKPDAMGFRSGVYNMLDELPNAASGEQILATLRDPQRLGKYGAKAEEIELLGLPEFLDGKERVTKEDLKAFVEENRIEMEYEASGRENFVGEPYEVSSSGDFEDLISDYGRSETSEFVFGISDVSAYGPDGDALEGSANIEEVFNFNLGNIEYLLRDLELTVDSMEAYQVFPRDPEFNPDIAERLTGERGANYVLPEIAEPLAEAKKIFADAGDDEYQLERQKDKLMDILGHIDDNTGGAVYSGMQSLAEYRVYDDVGRLGYEGPNYESAVEYANEYLDGNTGSNNSAYTFPSRGLQNYQEFRVLMPSSDGRFPDKLNVSQHFEENTFSFFRSTDRDINLEGGDSPVRARFVEEIQSDAAQQANKKGIVPKGGEQEARDAFRASEKKIGAHQDAFVHKPVVDALLDLERRLLPDSYQSDGNKVTIANRVFDTIYEAIATQRVGGIPRAYVSEEMPGLDESVSTLDSVASRAIDALNLPREGGRLPYTAEDKALITTAVYEMLRNLNPEQRADFNQVIDTYKTTQSYLSGVPDFPMRKNWVEVTAKSAIADAVENGHSVIAFPNSRATVAEIENYGAPRDDAITRLYEKDLPKVLKKLARQYDGTVEVGRLSDADSVSTRIEDSGSVIVLRLNDPQKVRREGIALPSVIGGGTAATGAAMQNDNEPAADRGAI